MKDQILCLKTKSYSNDYKKPFRNVFTSSLIVFIMMTKNLILNIILFFTIILKKNQKTTNVHCRVYLTVYCNE